jgi:hypothetical protein
MSGLRLDEGEDKELSSDLALIDKGGRAGVVGSNGGGSYPHLRLVDRRQKLRLYLGLELGGEPRLYVADEEGKPIVRQSAFFPLLAKRSIVYQALLYGALLFATGVGSSCIAGTASASFESLPAALITAVALVVLVGWLVAIRRGR